MKRLTAMLLILLLAMCGGAAAEGVQVTAAGEITAAAEKVSDVVTSYAAYGEQLVMTAEWVCGGQRYECCLGGLTEELTEEDVRTIIGGFMSGNTVTLTGDSLVDAEKASNKLPTAYGEPIEKDSINGDWAWGDSKLCWAGSVSDMLWITGWGQKATDPVTGEPFKDEDALFSCFTAAFVNNGGYQADGAVWFFSGKFERDVGMTDVREEGSGGFLPGIETPASKIKLGETEQYTETLYGYLSMLREGASMGIDMIMETADYAVKGNTEIFAAKHEDGTYVAEELHFIYEAEKTERRTFVLDRTGGIVFVCLADGLWTDETGGIYDARDVMEGVFAQYGGAWYPATKEENMSEEDRYFMVPVTVEESDIEGEAVYSYCGAHALTVAGYIRKAGDEQGCEALFIIDSDNDAHYYSPVGEGVLKQDRPDTYTLYFTYADEREEIPTIGIDGYLDRRCYIGGASLLLAAP